MLVSVAGLAGSGKDTVADRLCEKYGFVRVSFADPLKRFAMEVYDFTEEQLWGPSECRNAPDMRYQRGWKLSCGCICTEWRWHDKERRGFMLDGMLDLCQGHEDHPQWWRGRIIWPGDDEGAEPQPEYLTPRLALQILGTEFGRYCYPNTWVDYAIRVYRRLQTGDVYYDRVRGLRTLSTVAQFDNPMMRPKINVVIPDLRFINEFEGIEKAGGHPIRIVRPGSGLKGKAGRHASETQSRLIPDSRFKHVIDNTTTLENLAAAVDGIMGCLPAT